MSYTQEQILNATDEELNEISVHVFKFTVSDSGFMYDEDDRFVAECELDWNPTRDYNQAMMLRDRCDKGSYTGKLGVVLVGGNIKGRFFIDVAFDFPFADTRQITQAACLAMLEGECQE